MEDSYEIVTRLGQGACGAVYLARNKETKKLFALKKIQLDENRKNRTKKAVLREANILATLKHPNIVQYYESFFDEKDECLCIVQDYCDGGTLDEKINEAAKKKDYFPEKQVMRWFIQISMAVQYMHSQKVLHRDLKSQNVFMTKTGMTCKLGDFGISKMMDATVDMASTCVGTPCYLSPEMCQDIPYSSKADVWALGCLLYEICALRPAFDANNLISLFYKIVKGEFEPIPSHYSEALSEVVKAVLVKNPDDRPSAKAVLNLPYVKDELSRYIEEKEYRMQMKAIRDASQTGVDRNTSRNSNKLLSVPGSPFNLSRASSVEPDSKSESPLLRRRKQKPARSRDASPCQQSSRPVSVSPLKGLVEEASVSDGDSVVDEPQISLSDEEIARMEEEIMETEEDEIRRSVEFEKATCVHCGKQFRLKSWLQKHLAQKHAEGGAHPDRLFGVGESTTRREAPLRVARDLSAGQDSSGNLDVADYPDDFDEDSGSEEEDIPEELPDGLAGSMSDNDGELEEAAFDYADDFEEYDSDENLDEVVTHAKEVHDGKGPDDEVIMDEGPAKLINTCKNLLQEHCIAQLGKEKYEQVKKCGEKAIKDEDLRPKFEFMAGFENVEVCYLLSELLHD